MRQPAYRPTASVLQRGFIFLALALFNLSAGAQNAKCPLGLEQSPAFRSFKLGMSKQAAEQAFGTPINIYNKNEANDTAALSVSAYEYPDKLKNVVTISADLFDDKIYHMQITYKTGAFANHTQAQEMLNREWKLPNAWSAVKYGDSMLYCDGWTLVLRLSGGSPQLEIGIPGTKEKISARVKEKATKAFKL